MFLATSDAGLCRLLYRRDAGHDLYAVGYFLRQSPLKGALASPIVRFTIRHQREIAMALFGQTMVLYLIVGLGVATAVYLSERKGNAPGPWFRVATAIPF